VLCTTRKKDFCVCEVCHVLLSDEERDVILPQLSALLRNAVEINRMFEISSYKSRLQFSLRISVILTNNVRSSQCLHVQLTS
jgi:hypothetical protein